MNEEVRRPNHELFGALADLPEPFWRPEERAIFVALRDYNHRHGIS
jgi:hypothetical protein